MNSPDFGCTGICDQTMAQITCTPAVCGDRQANMAGGQVLMDLAVIAGRCATPHWPGISVPAGRNRLQEQQGAGPDAQEGQDGQNAGSGGPPPGEGQTNGK